VRFKRLTATVSLFAVGLSCDGCSTFSVIDTSQPQNVAAQLEVGRRIRVLDAAGERRTLKVAEIADDHLIARDRTGADVRVDLADVQRLERRDFAPWKTAGLVTGLVLFGLAVLTVEAVGEALSAL
jgi:hypothetical protein